MTAQIRAAIDFGAQPRSRRRERLAARQAGRDLSLDPNTGAPLGTIMLQYNPETLTRSLKPQSVGEEPDRTEILRLKGPPIETIRGEVEIDATDQLAASDPRRDEPRASSPQLSALELLVYPSSSVLIANEVLSLLGTIEILPMDSALTVFAWDRNRITPVRITEHRDHRGGVRPAAQPDPGQGHAGMRVLSVNDVGFISPAGGLYMAYQITKEAMAGSRPREHAMDQRTGSTDHLGGRNRRSDQSEQPLLRLGRCSSSCFADGTPVMYLARRIVPQASTLQPARRPT